MSATLQTEHDWFSIGIVCIGAALICGIVEWWIRRK